MNYDFECPSCGWTGHRYANLKVCPKCRAKVQRMMTVEQAQDQQIAELKTAVRSMWPVFASALSYIEHRSHRDLKALEANVEAAHHIGSGILDTIIEAVGE